MEPIGHFIPEVSVILCFYNEEKFLPEAVGSVLAQTFKRWEFILVDDGSKDGSTKLAKTFAAKYANIYYVEHAQHANLGHTASRNQGLKFCTAPLIAFLDADDVWLPDKLTHQVKLMETWPEVGLLAQASLYWWSWQNPKAQDIQIPIGLPPGLYYPPQVALSLYPLKKGAAPVPSGIMVRKKALVQIGQFEETFSGEFQVYEDQAFLIKLYLNTPVYIDSACHNLYRQRQGSLVSDTHSNGRYHKVRAYFLQWLKSYLIENNLHDKRIWSAWRNAAFQYRFPYLYKYSTGLTNRVKAKIRHTIWR